MSVSAHRIEYIKSEEYGSFSLSSDSKLADFLDTVIDFSGRLDSESCGIVEIPISVLEDAINIADSIDLSADTLDLLNGDIEHAKSQNKSYVIYYVY